jgi:uncharacterized protein
MEEALRVRVEETPDLLVGCGSRLYGTNREDSDHDLRGFVIPPFEYLINVKQFEYAEVAGGEDHKIYSLHRYIDLVISGDPLLTELLFAPPQFIHRCSEIGRTILNNRNLFLSNRIYDRVTGYGNSEFRKAMGVKYVMEERAKDDDDIIAWIRDKKHWEKERMDQFVQWMDESRPAKLVPSRNDLGAKRKAEFDKYGYGVSSAAHSLRLMKQVIELMLTGAITFPRPDAELLRDIRQGRISRETVEQMRDELVIEAETARKSSILPNTPNRAAIMNLYASMVRKFLSIG